MVKAGMLQESAVGRRTENSYRVHLDENTPVDLPLIMTRPDFGIYAFILIGRQHLNAVAAHALCERIRESGRAFDLLLTAEAKALGMVEQLATVLGHERYVVARKSIKTYMQEPVTIRVKSITDEKVQTFCLDGEERELLKGKRICFVDDVVSQGGTLKAVFQLASIVGFEVSLIACVLTEGEKRTDYQGVPLISLDHIPLPFV
jgi:adenine phosphoribosyltransferase